MNEDDHQRADDLERVLDEGDLARATKMARKWATSNAQVALGEVQRRNDAFRREALGQEPSGGGAAVDVERFARRDEELVTLRAALDDD